MQYLEEFKVKLALMILGAQQIYVDDFSTHVTRFLGADFIILISRNFFPKYEKSVFPEPHPTSFYNNKMKFKKYLLQFLRE